MKLFRWYMYLLLVLSASGRLFSQGGDHEVWVIDQSDTTADGGGTLYIYDGSKLAGAATEHADPEVLDLGGAARALCLAQTGTAPRRPHMLGLNAAHTHVILSFVFTGHVLFIEAAGRTPAACIDVGAQAHAAFAAPDSTYVLVANQAGKLLQRINTDYATNTFTLDGAATLNLATCLTPSGAPCEHPVLRPDNAPICPGMDPGSRFNFVTLRGGGLFVVDSKATPMAIVAEYDRDTVHPNGCVGLPAAGKMYISSGGGTAGNPLEADLYSFPLTGYSGVPSPPNTPTPTVVFSHDARGFVDAHGSAAMRHGRYLWVGDRAANSITIVDTATDAVVDEIPLAGPLTTDPAPDLMDIAPSGNRIYFTMRGPIPLTGNAAAVNNAVGNSPGVGILRVEANGSRGVLHAVARISHVVNNVERADPHAIIVRRN